MILSLDKTSQTLLDYLIQIEQPETITEISKNLCQSRRKVYYHLKKINQSLPDDTKKIINYPHIGILLNDDQKRACIELLSKSDTTQYVMSIEERQWLIIIYICISNEFITINKLMELVDVSHNTILNDLNNIRELIEFEQFNIHLRVKKFGGYYIECHLLSKIQFIYKILHEIHKSSSEAFKSLIHEKLLSNTSFSHYHSLEKKDFLKTLLKEISNDLGKILNRKDSEFMLQILPYLLMVSYNSGINAYNYELIRKDFILVQERIEYKVSEKLVSSLESEFNVSFDQMAKNIIALLLLSLRKDSDIHNVSNDYDDMRETLELFLSLFEHEYNINISKRNMLLNQLLTHCKSLLYQKTYNIPSDTQFTNNIKEKFNYLFMVTKRCITLLEEAWLIHMTDDDIAYIAIHLGGAIHNNPNSEIPVKKITLICDEGIGMRKFFLKQCQSYISNAYIDTVFTLEEFDSVKEILNSDIIISTSDAIETDIPVIFVNPILTNEDIIRIVSYRYSSNEINFYNFSNQLDLILKHYIRDESEQYNLRNQIEKLFLKELIQTLETKNF
ncbi:ascorbate 6-phosphate lactonase [Staphylococcus lugdunensis]|uniref:BglG family transcription antiterminator n=1 Tax=Staphylococcus lugdunensis TaxID=28035 RepID=UPI000DC73244|nr:transcription antiterminator [Staphylococcus lugdunensis]ARJ09387.1 ascorbate 6-phosphate lactonase [Staphylococcus lugdunensis]